MAVDWLPWAPLGAALLHICEEFFIPGGFPAWYRRYRANAARVTPRFLFLVNAGLIVGCAEVGLLARTAPGIFYWLALAAVMCSNGIWHVWASYRSRAYSPGAVTGALIYVPLAIYGFALFSRTGDLPLSGVLLAGILGGSYPIWSAMYHGVKPRAKDTRIAK